MNKRVYPSGATKRKASSKKKKKEEEEVRGVDIRRHFAPNPAVAEEEGSETNRATTSAATAARSSPDEESEAIGLRSDSRRRRRSTSQSDSDAEQDLPENDIVRNRDDDPAPGADDGPQAIGSSEVEHETVEQQKQNLLDLKADFPTDRFLFSEAPQDRLKRAILDYGVCQFSGPFPVQVDGRKFSADHYVKNLKGQKLRRTWLGYSPSKHLAYCQTCWLFADRANPSFKPNWVDGIEITKHVSEKIKAHEESRIHVDAAKAQSFFLKSPLEAELRKQLEAEKNFWRQVLRRIFRIVLSLASGNTALRGHKEVLQSAQHGGNFLETVKLLAEFDPVLDSLLRDPQKKIKYLSPQIQNEALGIMASGLRKKLLEEIRESGFFSIILDSTQDITRKDQVSLIIRHVSCDLNSKALDIRETFLGFFEISGHGAKSYEEFVLKSMSENGLDILNCRGQGYDGASVMSGKYSGLQRRILDHVPTAFYVHCAAHNLNLVLCDAASVNATVKVFFETIGKLYSFFSSSGIRWKMLGLVSDSYDTTIKKLSTTRWEAKHRAVHSILLKFSAICCELQRISLTSKKREERDEATALKKCITKFEFVACLVLWDKILTICHAASEKLQSASQDLSVSCTLMERAVAEVVQVKENFSSIYETALFLAKDWGTATEFELKRTRFRKRHFDEIGADKDKRLDSVQTSFQMTVFVPVCETVLRSLMNRFVGMRSVQENFSFLQPQILFDPNAQDFVSKSAQDFALLYEKDVSADLQRQCLAFSVAFRGEKEKLNTIKKVCERLVETELVASFPDFFTACRLYLTIPVSVASAERSFSKLKLLKNYLRSTMGQSRLSDMAILGIERERHGLLDIDTLIDQFAAAKARRVRI